LINLDPDALGAKSRCLLISLLIDGRSHPHTAWDFPELGRTCPSSRRLPRRRFRRAPPLEPYRIRLNRYVDASIGAGLGHSFLLQFLPLPEHGYFGLYAGRTRNRSSLCDGAVRSGYRAGFLVHAGKLQGPSLDSNYGEWHGRYFSQYSLKCPPTRLVSSGRHSSGFELGFCLIFVAQVA
jgi:hypothetical protein